MTKYYAVEYSKDQQAFHILHIPESGLIEENLEWLSDKAPETGYKIIRIFEDHEEASKFASALQYYYDENMKFPPNEEAFFSHCLGREIRD